MTLRTAKAGSPCTSSALRFLYTDLLFTLLTANLVHLLNEAKYCTKCATFTNSHAISAATYAFRTADIASMSCLCAEQRQSVAPARSLQLVAYEVWSRNPIAVDPCEPCKCPIYSSLTKLLRSSRNNSCNAMKRLSKALQYKSA